MAIPLLNFDVIVLFDLEYILGGCRAYQQIGHVSDVRKDMSRQVFELY